jgi:hypothetical protein
VPESGQEPTGNILDNPEVGGEEEHDEDEAGDEGGGEEPAEQVQHHRHALEEQVQEDHQAVGGPATPLQHNPDKSRKVLAD